jgi:hypothetical protein
MLFLEVQQETHLSLLPHNRNLTIATHYIYEQTNTFVQKEGEGRGGVEVVK